MDYIATVPYDLITDGKTTIIKIDVFQDLKETDLHVFEAENLKIITQMNFTVP